MRLVGQRQARGGQGGAHSERRLGRYVLGDLQGPRQLLPRLDHVLHEADAEGLGGGDLVAGQQPAHGVGPAHLPRHADGGAAHRVDAALDLDLPEAGVGGGDAHVRGQQQFDADGEADALHRADQGLRDRRPVDAQRVQAVFGHGHAPAGEHRRPLGEVEATGEVVAGGVEHAAAQTVVVLQFAPGAADGQEHLDAHGVALLRPVEADQEEVAAAFEGDVLAHGAETTWNRSAMRPGIDGGARPGRKGQMGPGTLR